MKGIPISRSGSPWRRVSPKPFAPAPRAIRSTSSSAASSGFCRTPWISSSTATSSRHDLEVMPDPLKPDAADDRRGGGDGREPGV